MSAELQQVWTTGSNVYFLIRNSTSSIWNGTSFVSYATANYSSYAVTATEQGTASGFYTANMPSVATGVYSIVAKLRAGASPAESDFVIGTETLNWDGTNSVIRFP